MHVFCGNVILPRSRKRPLAEIAIKIAKPYVLESGYVMSNAADGERCAHGQPVAKHADRTVVKCIAATSSGSSICLKFVAP